MAKRVFELAKELKVRSKDILEKCRAEGLDLKNHMATLSAGLEATIREWFSEASSGTAVETAEHVDLAKARKKAASQRRRKKKAEEEPVQQVATAEEVKEEKPLQPVAVSEVPAEEVKQQVEPVDVQAAAEVSTEPKQDAAVAQTQAQPEAPTLQKQQPPATVEAKPQEPQAKAVEAAEKKEAAEVAPPVEEAKPQPEKKPEAPKAVPSQPPRPPVVKPAGPQVVPKPVKLQGPRVVRFDGIDIGMGALRPRGGKRAGKGKSAPSQQMPVSDMISRGKVSAPPSRGKKGQPSGDDEKALRSRRRSPRRKGGRIIDLTEGIHEWRDRDLQERSERLAAAAGGTLRRRRAPATKTQPKQATPTKTGAVEISQPITVKSLSAATGIKTKEIIRKLREIDIDATIDQIIDAEVAQIIASDCGIDLKIREVSTAEDQLMKELASRKRGQLVPRAPIVTFLGHVDHGKTSLLDRIRNAAVAAGEEGGITQDIGAYRYDLGGKHVVFLDTPGHEAFTAMRARGANMTDVVVLVVAADDGVMPQTIEAINHAKAADVPIIVALNKIDLPNANVQRALGQLAEHGLQPRQWGGQTEVVETSAVTGQGIDELVELLSLEAEILELKADPSAPAEGWVIEVSHDPREGVVVGLLVRDGTLRNRDIILCGDTYGRVRKMFDDRGKVINEAGPAMPVKVYGLKDMPPAGERFYVVSSLELAKNVAEERQRRKRTEAASVAPKASLEALFDQIESEETLELKLVVKADVQGTLEALLESIEKIKSDKVNIKILHSGVGAITESDVLLAEASEGIVLGFRVVPSNRAASLAESKGVEIRTYRVI
ncbi:MAG: translation initiation factor IF-2, partial [Planctomycetes bacterium]|nr:translation initiation factor IF-2 [Planctomycetota bacterium]